MLNFGVTTGHAVFSPSTYLERCGASLGLEGGDLTIEMWVQLSDDTSDEASLFTYLADIFGTDFSLAFDFGRLWLYADGVSVFSNDGAFNLADGAWHHVAFTTEESGGSCTYSSYKDGAIVGSPETRLDSCPTLPDGGCVLLGQYEGAECGSGWNWFNSVYEFQGNMTEVRLWRTAKSEAEILEGLSRRMTASKAASEAGLVAIWSLDCAYGLDDIKGAQHLGSCDSASGDNEPYSLAHIVGMECPCPDARYHTSASTTIPLHTTSTNTPLEIASTTTAPVMKTTTAPEKTPVATITTTPRPVRVKAFADTQ